MALELGRILGYTSDMMISAHIEYSFQKLESVELEPVTALDFSIIEENSEFIEQNLLNQMQVFYVDQLFVLHLQDNKVVKLKTKIKTKPKQKYANCFYLTQDCELHIIPKL